MSTSEQISFIDNPITQLKQWLAEASKGPLENPNAMTVTTIRSNGCPRSRVVLLKDTDAEGQLYFYTNYESFKGQEIANNDNASLHFYWDFLGRQISISGTLTKTSRQNSEDYWNSRPRESQLSQWVSQQSKPIDSFSRLEDEYQEAHKKFEGATIPCPDHWGGYVLKPQEWIFWVADPRRLHRRVLYQRSQNDEWSQTKLYP